MIALLRGRVVTAGLGEVVLDVGGVGYAVHVPPGPPLGTAGAELTLHTHLAVREDSLTLYGFPERDAKALFETLLGVTGIGPKVALAALGTLGATGVRRAVIAEDVDALTVVPGIGRKGAQRLVLELRERLGAPPSDAVPGAAPGPPDARTDVAQALIGLGYAPSEVQHALDAVRTHEDPEPEEARSADGLTEEARSADPLDGAELLRAALQVLGGR